MANGSARRRGAGSRARGPPTWRRRERPTGRRWIPTSPASPPGCTRSGRREKAEKRAARDEARQRAEEHAAARRRPRRPRPAEVKRLRRPAAAPSAEQVAAGRRRLPGGAGGAHHRRDRRGTAWAPTGRRSPPMRRTTRPDADELTPVDEPERRLLEGCDVGRPPELGVSPSRDGGRPRRRGRPCGPRAAARAISSAVGSRRLRPRRAAGPGWPP